MKKIMKRITALLTCAAMLSSAAALQANAWGLRKTGFDPQDACDDKGMLGFTGDYFVACGGNRNDVPGTEYDYDYDAAIAEYKLIAGFCGYEDIGVVTAKLDEQKTDETKQKVIELVNKL